MPMLQAIPSEDIAYASSATQTNLMGCLTRIGLVTLVPQTSGLPLHHRHHLIDPSIQLSQSYI